MVHPVCDPSTVDNITIELQNSWRNVMRNPVAFTTRQCSLKSHRRQWPAALGAGGIRQLFGKGGDALVSRFRSAESGGRPVAAGSGPRERGVFQFVGFHQLPKASSEAMEPIFKLQALGGGRRFDLRENSFPQIVFDQKVSLLCSNRGYTDHFADTPTGALDVRFVAVRQSQFASFRDGPDIGNPLGAGIEGRDVIETNVRGIGPSRNDSACRAR